MKDRPDFNLSDEEIKKAAGLVNDDDLVQTFFLKNKQSLNKFKKSERTEMESAIFTGRIIFADLQKRFPNAFHPENSELNETIRNDATRSFAYLSMLKYKKGYKQAMKDVSKDIQNYTKYKK